MSRSGAVLVVVAVVLCATPFVSGGVADAKPVPCARPLVRTIGPAGPFDDGRLGFRTALVDIPLLVSQRPSSCAFTLLVRHTDGATEPSGSGSVIGLPLETPIDVRSIKEVLIPAIGFGRNPDKLVVHEQLRLGRGESVIVHSYGADAVIHFRGDAAAFRPHVNWEVYKRQNSRSTIADAKAVFGYRWPFAETLVETFRPDGTGWARVRKSEVDWRCAVNLCRVGITASLNDLNNADVMYFTGGHGESMEYTIPTTRLA